MKSTMPIRMTNTERHITLAYVLMFAVYIAISLQYRFMGYDNRADSKYILSATRDVIDLNFEIYTRRFSPDIAPPDGYGYTYMPLPAAVVVPFVLILKALGLERHLPDAAALPYVIFDVLCMIELRRTIKNLAPRVDEKNVLLVVFALLFSPLTFQTTVRTGHFELMMAYFVLLGIRAMRQNAFKSGTYFGLALGCKLSAMFAIVPAFFILARQAMANRTVRHLAVWTGAVSGTIVLLLSPYLLVSFSDVLFALTTGLNNLPVHQHTYWWIAYEAFGGVRESGPVYDFMKHYSNSLCMLATVLVVGTITWKRDCNSDLHRFLGLFVLGSFCFLLFAKMVWMTYAVLVTVLIALWDSVRSERTFPYFALFFLVGLAFLGTGVPWGLREETMLFFSTACSLYVLSQILSRETRSMHNHDALDPSLQKNRPPNN